MTDIFNYLKNNEYPGRGVAIGKSADGEYAVALYFIMGRSVNSRNRIFVEIEDGIKTEAFDPAKLSDPSLVIYSPVRKIGNHTIITNGDQTDTIYDYIKIGQSFEEALRTRCYEPDAPNFTPRISGIINLSDKPEELPFTYKLSILKNGGEEKCERHFFEYEPINGLGHIIHTYKCDGSPIPSFDTVPVSFAVENDMENFGEKVWDALNPENKVSLYVSYISIKTGEAKTLIFNKNK